MAAPEEGKVALDMDSIEFGFKLATTLETYAQLTSDARSGLEGLIPEVNGTASALRQLWAIITADNTAAALENRPVIFKDFGLAEVRLWGTQCESLYKTIIVLLQKATHAGAKPYEPPSVFEPTSVLKSITTLRLIKWKWLEPRLTRCEEQLKWLKIILLVNIQVANLAHLHLDKSSSRPTGSFDQEFGLRTAAESLWNRQANMTRRMAKRREKAKARRMPGTVTPTTVSARSVASDSTISLVEESDVKETKPGVLLAGAAKSKQDDESSVCSTVVDESQKQPDETISKSLKKKYTGLLGQDNIIKSATSHQSNDVNSPEKAVPDTQTQTTITGQDAKGEMAQSGNKEEGSTQTERALLSSSNTFLPPALSGFRAWFSFKSRDYNPLEDKASDELEAWITPLAPGRAPIKVPFGHQRLKQGFKRVRRSRGSEPWNVYMDLNLEQRRVIDELTKRANSTGDHARTCIAFDNIKNDGEGAALLVFFALSPAPAPLKFKDAVGRMFNLPWETVKNWEGMRQMINDNFVQLPVIGPLVLDGRYDLFKEDTNSTIIHPTVWNSSVQPGDSIYMCMWPVDAPRLRHAPWSANGYPPRPRNAPGYVPPSGNFAQGFTFGGEGPRPGVAPGMGMHPVMHPSAVQPFRPMGIPPLPDPRVFPRPPGAGGMFGARPPPPFPRPGPPPRVINVVTPPRRSTARSTNILGWMIGNRKKKTYSSSDSDSDSDSDYEFRKSVPIQEEEEAELDVVDFIGMQEQNEEEDGENQDDDKGKGKQKAKYGHDEDGGPFGRFLEKRVNINDVGISRLPWATEMWPGCTDSSSSSDSSSDTTSSDDSFGSRG